MKKILWMVALIPMTSFALNLPGAGGSILRVPVKSFSEIKFGEVVKQKYDFSCGSAALASLMSHHYNRPMTEAMVFEEMFRYGDKDKIEKQGFSMLDMKNFLARRGLRSDGFKVDVNQLESLAIPAIALVNYSGYNHFVVVKGIKDGRVLIGDPSLGQHIITIEQFENASNGVFLFVRDDIELAKASFNRKENWEHAPAGAPMRMALMQMPHMTDLMRPSELDY